MNQENAITIYDRMADPLDAVDRLGQTFSKSGMFGCEKEEQGKVLALACISERQNPFALLRTFHLINGRLSMRADAMLAEYHKRGGKIQWKVSDEKRATGLWSYQENQNVEISFTIEDAQRAQLIRKDSCWTKFPDAMLRARCISKALRMIAPEVVAGVYLPDERPIEVEVTTDSSVAAPLLSTVDPAPAKAAATIDVAVVPADPAQVEAKPSAEPAPSKPASEDPPLDRLLSALRPHAAKCVAYWVKAEWVKADEIKGKDPVADFDSIAALVKPAQVSRILARTDAFIKKINE